MTWAEKRLWVTFGLIVPPMCFAQVQYVPTYHSVYRIVDYLIAAGDITPKHESRPYTRSEVANWLFSALEKETGIKQKGTILRYLSEFQDGLAEKQPVDGTPEVHTLEYSFDDGTVYSDVIIRGSTMAIQKTRPYFRTDVGGNIRGHVGRFASFQTEIIYSAFLGNQDLLAAYGIKDQLAPVLHGPTAFFPNSSDTRFVTSQLMGTFAWGLFSAGTDAFKWGPGRSGNLLINIDHYPLPNVHVTVDLGNIRLSQFYGTLNRLFPYIEKGQKLHLASKRKIVARRIDLKLSSRLRAGISESIVYNREFELSYINPLYPFTVSEIGAGDKDNNLISIDVTARLFQSMKTYLEILVDDYNFRKNPFTYFGNKWGILLGHQWARPFQLEGSLLTVELVSIEPWVYSHRDSANIYEFYGESIGYDMEPNSAGISTSLDWFLERNLWLKIIAQHSEHGSGDRVFGIPEDPKEPKRFHEGTVERKTRIGVEIDYEFFQNMWIRFSLWQEIITDEKKDDTFASFGGDRSQRGLRLSIDLNY